MVIMGGPPGRVRDTGLAKCWRYYYPTYDPDSEKVFEEACIHFDLPRRIEQRKVSGNGMQLVTIGDTFSRGVAGGSLKMDRTQRRVNLRMAPMQPQNFNDSGGLIELR